MNNRATVIDSANLIGDLYAPEGSEPWCIGMRHEIQTLLEAQKTDHENLIRCMESMTKYEGWKKLKTQGGGRFRSYSEFCKSPRPFGLGRDPHEVDALLKEGAAKRSAQAMAASDEVEPLAEKANQHTVAVNNINGRPVGTSSEYIVRRLKRDHPDIAKQLANGEFKSARAAGIAAGFVKVQSIVEIAKRAVRKMSAEEIAEFASWFKDNV